MLKRVIVVTSIAGLPVLNEYAKTYITKTKVFKKTINQINTELNQIDIKLNRTSISSQDQINNETQNQNLNKLSEVNKQEEQLFDMIITPQVQKMLSTKSKNKVELIKKLRDQQQQNLRTNALIMGVHSFGSLMPTSFFYWSSIGYCFLSQLSLLNDLFTLKTGNKLISYPFKSLSQLYLKVSSVILVFFTMKSGLKMLANHFQTKQIVKKEP